MAGALLPIAEKVREGKPPTKEEKAAWRLFGRERLTRAEKAHARLIGPPSESRNRKPTRAPGASHATIAVMLGQENRERLIGGAPKSSGISSTFNVGCAQRPRLSSPSCAK